MAHFSTGLEIDGLLPASVCIIGGVFVTASTRRPVRGLRSVFAICRRSFASRSRSSLSCRRRSACRDSSRRRRSALYRSCCGVCGTGLRAGGRLVATASGAQPSKLPRFVVAISSSEMSRFCRSAASCSRCSARRRRASLIRASSGLGAVRSGFQRAAARGVSARRSLTPGPSGRESKTCACTTTTPDIVRRIPRFADEPRPRTPPRSPSTRMSWQGSGLGPQTGGFEGRPGDATSCWHRSQRSGA